MMRDHKKSGAQEGLRGGIDAGGTSFKCALATEEGKILAATRVATAEPALTLDACAGFFLTEAKALGRKIAALGIAAFGPIDIDPESASYGAIQNTPKPGWSGVNLRNEFNSRLGVPIVIDTDVNGALAAELKWGAARGVRSAAYVTVGTGIGAGIFAAGGFIGKPRHPEFGHIRIQRAASDLGFAGVCPIHGNCLEGLASAPAFTARHGAPEALSPHHSGWDVEAYYLAQACVNLSLSFRPDRILLGGGLLLAPRLLEKIRQHYAALMNGYLGESDADIDALIQRPALGDDAGLMGGVALALTVLR